VDEGAYDFLSDFDICSGKSFGLILSWIAPPEMQNQHMRYVSPKHQNPKNQGSARLEWFLSPHNSSLGVCGEKNIKLQIER